MIDRLLASLASERSKRIRVRLALLLFVASLILWPISAFTWAKDEPQFILGLSFLAITLTAWDILTTAQVHEENGGSDGD